MLLALASIRVAVYLILFEDALYVRESEFIASDYVFAAMAVLLAMEFARRTSGWFMPVLIIGKSRLHTVSGPICSGCLRFSGPEPRNRVVPQLLERRRHVRHGRQHLIYIRIHVHPVRRFPPQIGCGRFHR